MEKLFELTFQDQALNPQVGTLTDASQATGTFTLEDGEYYLTNADSKGFYTYAPIAIQPDSETDNKVTVEFDLKVVTASVNTHTIIGTYAGVDGSGIPTGAKITLQYNAGDIELVLGSGTTATLIAAADVVVDQWYHFSIGCALDAPAEESTYQVKIDGVLITTVTGATTDYELGIIGVLGTDLHACDECGIKNIRLITDDDYFVGRTALDQVLQDVKGYVDSHNGVLTIQKNGANIGTFSANASTNATANITVPTKTSDLTNDSGFITSDNTKIPLAGSNQISGSLIPATDNSIDIGSSTNNIKMLYTKGIAIDAKTIDTDANGNMTYDGHIVDTIEEQGNGYIRYSNGIQICWGNVQNNNNMGTGKSRFSFPKTFTDEHINVVATPNATGAYVVTANVESISTWILNTMSLLLPSPFYVGDPVLVGYIAIGTWK